MCKPSQWEHFRNAFASLLAFIIILIFLHGLSDEPQNHWCILNQLWVRSVDGKYKSLIFNRTQQIINLTSIQFTLYNKYIIELININNLYYYYSSCSRQRRWQQRRSNHSYNARTQESYTKSIAEKKSLGRNVLSAPAM